MNKNKTRNKEQVKIKAIKSYDDKKFIPESNPALAKWFDKVTNMERRLKN